jgi:hypothetical protein
MILGKTNLGSTPVFQSINKYLATLASTGLDDKTKFGIALKQAQTIDNLDIASIPAIFEKAKTELADFSNNFAQAIVNKTSVDVEAKKAKAAELQAQAAQLNEEAFAAGQKLQSRQHQFDVAMQKRQSELAQEQAKYASFLA